MRQRQQIYQGKGRKQSKIIEKEFQDFEEYKSIFIIKRKDKGEIQ